MLPVTFIEWVMALKYNHAEINDINVSSIQTYSMAGIMLYIYSLMSPMHLTVILNNFYVFIVQINVQIIQANSRRSNINRTIENWMKRKKWIMPEKRDIDIKICNVLMTELLWIVRLIERRLSCTTGSGFWLQWVNGWVGYTTR